MTRLVVAMFSNVEVGRASLDYHLERHNVLAGNVANLETPGFVPHELLRPVEAPVSAGGLRTTHASHMSLGHEGGAHYEVATETVATPGNDGNGVSLERELSRVAANHLRYEGVARLVQMQIGTLRYAANDGSGG
jgi:flagellar basal-body rod protein FlgB